MAFSIIQALLMGLAIHVSAAPQSRPCQAVQYPSQVFLGDETKYSSEQTSFWSTIQGAVSPTCFFQPESAEEVASAVVAARGGTCKFAVKSGGHYSFTASTIAGGLVVDLARLNKVTVSQDRQTAAIEPGGRWADVYPILQKYGLTVPGGRMFGVGVGGLSLGGGISWLSNLHGWTCDNILEYEVVLADGCVITANPKSHKDLFWALRGGGSNFGVVTKFKFIAYEQGRLWNGNLRFDADANVTANAAFTTWGDLLAPKDLKSGGVLLWDAHADGPPTGLAILTHADTFAENSHPEVFDRFYEVGPNNVTEGNAFHAEIAEGLVIPGGVTRNSMWTTSFVLDAELMQSAFDIWSEESASIASFAAQQLQLQIFTRSQLAFMKRNGGNPTGMAKETRPVGFVNLLTMWEKSEDDKHVYQVQQRMEDRINAAAKKRGLDSIFKYTNYASQFQDPFAGYGSDNKKQLLKIAKKYDPEGVFQTLVEGGFKLSRGPPHL
ncbi:FAD binding domain-containing protein [Fusarium proliferatum]|nr:FAD binding domain-containing protein [Fusarium proliferatum]